MASRVPILMYHRIGSQSTAWDAHYSVTPEMFAGQMAALAKAGYSACSLPSFLAWLNQGESLPEKSVLITFDDGFCGVYDHALPVLRMFGWPFTVFVVTDKIGQPADWAQIQTPADRSRWLMNHEELATLVAHGASLQSHTASHRDLASLCDEDLSAELARSRHQLAAHTGHPAQSIAYPFGRHDERVIKAAKEVGYTTGFTVNPGFNRQNAEPFSLRRLDVFGSDTPARLLRKVTYGSNTGGISQDFKYFAKRLASRFQRQSDSSSHSSS